MGLFEAHLLILLCTVLVILYTDHLGFQYFLGAKETLSRGKVYTLHALVWAGLLGLTLTGLLMAYQSLNVLFAQPLFVLKMTFVAVLFINALAVGNLIRVATIKPFSALTAKEKAPLIVSGALSTVSWVGAVTSAVLLFGWPTLF